MSLDRQMVQDLRASFLEIVEADAPTVVFVTPLPEDAARLATRSVVLKGRPVQIAADRDFEVPRLRRSPEKIGEITARLAASSEGGKP